jgi:RNA recognition motif-containing protein
LKGCGLAEFKSAADAKKAMEVLLNSDLDGRKIFIREDREQADFGKDKPKRQSGGGSGGGGGGGNNNNTNNNNNNNNNNNDGGDGGDGGDNSGGNRRSRNRRSRNRGGYNQTYEGNNDDQSGGSSSGGGGGGGGYNRGYSQGGYNNNNNNTNNSSSGSGNNNSGGGNRSEKREREDRPANTSISNLYVGNLPFATTDDELKTLFVTYGTVVKAAIAKTSSGRSKGFGTVTYGKETDAQAAIDALNNKDFNSRSLVVRMDHYSA